MSIKRFSCILIGTLCAAAREQLKQKPRDHGWQYPEDAEKWGGLCKSGTRQSPIHIHPGTVVKGQMKNLALVNYHRKFHYFKLINNGHGVKLQIDPRLNIMIKSGPLNNYYILEDIHWHWNGTEHTIEGKKDERLVLEMHLVHRNIKYKTLKEAMGNKDGIAVLGCLFKESASPNPVLDKIFRLIPKVTNPNQVTYVQEPFSIRQLLPPSHAYYTYQGSLTTPPCKEVVTWIIFRGISHIQRDQIGQLSQVKDSRGRRIITNCRDRKPIYNREIYFNRH